MADDLITKTLDQLGEVAELEATDRLLFQRGAGPAQTSPVQAVMNFLEANGVGAVAAAEAVAAKDIVVATAADVAEDAATAETARLAAEASAGANALAATIPNLFDPEELQGSDFDNWVVTNGTFEAALAADGLPAWKITAAANLTWSAVRTFTKAEFLDRNVSESLRVLALDAAPSGSLSIRMRFVNDSGVQVGTEETSGNIAGSAGLAFLATRAASTILNKPWPVGATGVQFRIVLANGGPAAAARVCWVRDATMVQGSTAGFRPAAPKTLRLIIPKAFWLSETGSDSNIGDESNPFLTPAAAFAAVVDNHGVGDIEFPRDVASSFRMSDVSIAGIRHLKLNAPGPRKPRLIGSDPITGWTPHATLPDVWTVAVAAGLMTDVNWIYQDGVPDPLTEITSDIRLTRHGNATHGLPMTRVWPEPSEAGLATVIWASFFHDGANLHGKFLDADGNLGGDPNDFDIYIPSATSMWTGQDGTQEVELVGVEGWYQRRSIWTYNLAYATLTDVGAYGAKQDNFRFDNSRGEALRCHAGGAGNDDFNGHISLVGDQTYDDVTCQWTFGDCWGRHAFDDEFSFHEGARATSRGGLWEFGGDRAVATCCGGKTKHHGDISRFCGQLEGNGEGFSAIGASPAGLDGSTICEVFGDCVSEGNIRNYSAGIGGEAGNQLIVHAGASSIDAVSAHYHAAAGASVKVDRPSYHGTGTYIVEETGGTVTTRVFTAGV